jgi:hypothetical protein
MPAELIEEPLAIRVITSRGTHQVVPITPGDNPALARDLAVGLAGLVHPHGPLDSVRTVGDYADSIHALVAALPSGKAPGGAAGIRRGPLLEYLLGARSRREAHARALLRSFDEERGTLDAQVRPVLVGRPFKKEAHAPLPPFTEGEWRRISEACRTALRASFADWREGVSLAERGRDPFEHGVSLQNACWLVANRGPVTEPEVAERLGKKPWQRYEFDGGFAGTFARANAMLLPSIASALPAQLLLGMYTGMVPDGIAALEVGGLEYAGDAAMLLSYFKGRASDESLTVGPRVVRLMERWLEFSALARRIAPAPMREGLWLRYSATGRYTGWSTKPITGASVGVWTAKVGLVAEDGAAFALNRRRIRTTFLASRDRSAWTGSGRALVDPNHSARVEAENYLGTPTAAQKDVLEDVIAEAQADLLRKAHPPMVLTGDDAAELAERFPDLAASAGLDDAAIRELAGGSRDVFAAGCADHLAGQFGTKGQACPARPWVCLLCPLAVFAPRHLPNLLRLRAYFARAFGCMSAAAFMSVFGYYAQRVDQVIEAFRAQIPDQVAAAGALVSDTDHEVPLLAEELTA